MSLRSAAGLALFVLLLAPLASAQGPLRASPDPYDDTQSVRLTIYNTTSGPVTLDSLRIASTETYSAIGWSIDYRTSLSGQTFGGTVYCDSFRSGPCFDYEWEGRSILGETLAPGDSVVVTDLDYYCGLCRSAAAPWGQDTLRIYSGGSVQPLNVSLMNVYPTASSATPDVPGFRLTLAPNPAGEQATVSLTRPTTGEVRVVAYDALGRETIRLHDGPAPEALTLRLDTSAWLPGVYVVRAEADGQSTSTRLVVAR